ncbi:MAG: ATP-grasp domain-containing protein [Lachnospiraceae bacterium]|nr:ATP-grasp domain-containing protein [Ruminococcus sp.]MCM1277226.1 ATP-grasp domain-containing protein [Lachnospiraceae bacterium]
MKNFLIQTRTYNDNIIPATSFGYTAFEIAEYYHWFDKDDCRYAAHYLNPTYSPFLPSELTAQNIPVGSVEFALDWFKQAGIENIKPLNIPKELWEYCRHYITIDKYSNVSGHFMMKDTDKIKAENNGEYFFHGVGGDDKKYFLSRWVEDVKSEWRAFIYDGDVRDIRCYSGDPWVIPDKAYVEEIAKIYSDISKKRAFTLDVMVTDCKTDIVELHDFFSCGLYGFEDYSVLPLMWSAAVTDIFKEAGKL